MYIIATMFPCVSIVYSNIILFQSNMATDFINARHTNDRPFLMVLAPPAPHAPFTPAIRHFDIYKGTKAKRTPNFNMPSQMVHFIL